MAVKSNTNLQKQLQKLWTVQDLVERFGVTAMTIHTWRKNRGLPALVIPGDARASIRFIPQEVRRWARENAEEINNF